MGRRLFPLFIPWLTLSCPAPIISGEILTCNVSGIEHKTSSDFCRSYLSSCFEHTLHHDIWNACDFHKVDDLIWTPHILKDAKLRGQDENFSKFIPQGTNTSRYPTSSKFQNCPKQGHQLTISVCKSKSLEVIAYLKWWHMFLFHHMFLWNTTAEFFPVLTVRSSICIFLACFDLIISPIM